MLKGGVPSSFPERFHGQEPKWVLWDSPKMALVLRYHQRTLILNILIFHDEMPCQGVV